MNSTSRGRLRPTLEVKHVAKALGVSPSRVRQMLDDAKCGLDGPPSGGRGRSRLVWADTLDQVRAGSETSAEAADQIASLQQQLASMTTALHHVNFAAERMRDALEEQDRAFRLLERAQRAQRRAFKRLRQAEAAREEAMSPFTIEDMPT